MEIDGSVMMEDKIKAGEYESDAGARYRQLNDEVSTLRDQLFAKDAEIERLRSRLGIQVGVVDVLEKEIEEIKDSRYV